MQTQAPVVASYQAPATAPPPQFSRSHSLPVAGGMHGNFRPGDWLCSVCDGHVYASKSTCRCGATKASASRVIEPAPLQRARSLESSELYGRDSPSSGLIESSTRKTVLPLRDRSNSPPPPPNKQSSFDREHSQRRDGLPRGVGGSGGFLPANWKPGDWLCPSCNDHVFARKDYCRCGEPKPSAQQRDHHHAQQSVGGNSSAPESGQSCEFKLAPIISTLAHFIATLPYSCSRLDSETS